MSNGLEQTEDGTAILELPEFESAVSLYRGAPGRNEILSANPGPAREAMHSFMKASPRTITLFAEHSDDRRPPFTFAASILIHTAAFSLVGFGVLYTPPIITNAPLDRYAVRRLDLHMPDLHPQHSAADDLAYPGPHPAAHTLAAGGKDPASSHRVPPIPKATHGPQTIVQPDLNTRLTIAEETPLPQVLLWSPSKTPVVKIVAPVPQKPAAVKVTPTLAPPNEEANLRDIAIASVPQPSLNQLVVPSTTAPVEVRGPQPAPLTPATVSQSSAKPTAAAVVSLSDVQMKNGTVMLPPVNEVAADSSSGTMSLKPGPAKSSTAPGSGNTESTAAGSGTGTGKAVGSNAGSGSKFTIAGPGQAPASAAGPGQGNQPSATAISLAKEGRFGAVIVGASLEDQYPEISDVWKGRMAYTVYLHVGLAKSWILQYSLPRSTEAAESGTVAHLEAPWPYSIVRPNLPPGSIEADALMIHGFVNNAGRFETLSVAFPSQFPDAQFVLDSLKQWQFRPASQNGQTARVEVLLIIPEVFE
jgi:hypothetical protein